LSNQQEVEQEQASTENWGKEPQVGSSSSVENTFSPIMHENPASVQSPYDQQNQQELDPYVAEIIGLNSGSELAQLLLQETQLASSNPAAFFHPTQQLQQSTHFLSSSQPGHRPQPHRGKLTYLHHPSEMPIMMPGYAICIFFFVFSVFLMLFTWNYPGFE